MSNPSSGVKFSTDVAANVKDSIRRRGRPERGVEIGQNSNTSSMSSVPKEKKHRMVDTEVQYLFPDSSFSHVNDVSVQVVSEVWKAHPPDSSGEVMQQDGGPASL